MFETLDNQEGDKFSKILYNATVFVKFGAGWKFTKLADFIYSFVVLGIVIL